MPTAVILRRFDGKYVKSAIEWSDDIMDAMVFHLTADTVEAETATLTLLYQATAIKLPECPVSQYGGVYPFRDALGRLAGWDAFSDLFNAESFITQKKLQNEYREFLMKKAHLELGQK